MDYEKINWKNQPNKQTPINATNLNHMDDGIYEAHERIDANSIISTATGETILVTDSAKVPPENIKLFGKTTQVITGGNQLFNPDILNGSTTCTENDGDITVTISTTDTYLAGSYSTTGSVLFTLGADTYAIGCSDSNIRVSIYCVVDGMIHAVDTNNENVTFNTTANVVGVRIRSIDGTNLKGKAFKIMLNAGSTLLNYEPYTGGKPSPSIDYPQPLDNVGANGSIIGKILTGNVLKYSRPKNYTETKNGVTLTILEDGGIRLTGTNTSENVMFYITEADYLLPDGEYALYVNGLTNGICWLDAWNGWKQFWEVDGKKEYVVIHSDGVRVGMTNACTPRITISVQANATVNTVVYPMLSMCKTLTHYEQYSEQPFLISTPNGLPGIPVSDTSIANYIDETGQAWVSDYVDFERGKLVHMVAQEIIEGTPVFSETNVSGRFVWTRALTKTYKNADEYALSNFAKYNYWGVPNQTEDVFAVHGAYGNKSLYYAPSVQMTADEVNAKFAEMIASDNPPVIVGQLAEPFETDLTSSELAQYNALCMNYPNTTITNDSEAYTEVEYVASPKEYIANLEKKHDNDIQQLKTAIIALGGTI